MSHNMTSILTTVAMLLHSIFGCCAHHAHACEHADPVAGCQAEHDEHHSSASEVAGASEVAHAENHGAAHDDCSTTSERAGHDGHEVAPRFEEGRHSDSHEDGGSLPHRHAPCQQNCDEGDCSFTQPSVVKTPLPDAGKLSFPVIAATVSGLIGCAQASASRTDAGPPHARADECCRPMFQVWLL